MKKMETGCKFRRRTVNRVCAKKLGSVFGISYRDAKKRIYCWIERSTQRLFKVVDMLGGDRAVSVENKVEHLPRALVKSWVLVREVHHDGLR